VKSFLSDIASQVISKVEKPENICLVFPSRRAALYFKKEYTQLLSRPVLAPALMSIEDLYHLLSKQQRTDDLQLIHKLHAVYKKIYKSNEAFEQFYFWGKMLLRDFDEIDKYLVNANYIFKNLSSQKELDNVFDFLTEEHKQFLQEFWSGLIEKNSDNQKNFIAFWERLSELYAEFRILLKEEGLVYEGMLQRQVVENLESSLANLPYSYIIFAGFNALTRTDELLISHLIKNNKAEIHWDTDAYYLNDTTQEAGHFLRQYKAHEIFSNSFPDEAPWNLKAEGKQLNIYGTAQQSAQIKLLCQQIGEQLSSGMKEEDTVVILPNEQLMLPVLQSLAPVVKHINVTMGYPLMATACYQFLELLIDLQSGIKAGNFNHKKIQALLAHPYVQAIEKNLASSLIQKINKENRTQISAEFFNENNLFSQLFQIVETSNLIQYLIQSLDYIAHQKQITDLDKEYAFHLHKQLNRIHDVLKNDIQDIRSFQRLFRQLCKSQRIPFQAEPLKGIQVMGVLETRNIDFKNVFVLSLNEGSWPANASGSSYIPYNIRRAYGLPSVEHQDAIYAYLFYRVLQRAENIHLFYNTESDAIGGGERSRYLQQIIFESGLPFKEHVLSAKVSPAKIQAISITKDEQVMKKLRMFTDGHPAKKALYPTYLTDYLECSLRFYFKHVEQIREADEVEDDLDARVLGDILHRVMEKFYLDLKNLRQDNTVEKQDIELQEKTLTNYIDKVFAKKFPHLKDQQMAYEGQQLIVKEIVLRFARQVLKHDKAYAPFRVIGLEDKNFEMQIPLDISLQTQHKSGEPEKVKVRIRGIIDRVDLKDNVVRIADYKTGGDLAEHKGELQQLFNVEKKINKAAFQVFTYALLYQEHTKTNNKILPGLIGRKDLFDNDYTFGLKLDGKVVNDAAKLLPEFKSNFISLVQEIYNPEKTFEQTSRTENCLYCSFKEICYR
jgi:hypothetical protein